MIINLVVIQMRLLGQVLFHNKISQAQNHLQRTKMKNYAQKISKTKNVTYLLICILCFYTFSAFSKNKESLHFFTSPTQLDFICIALV